MNINRKALLPYFTIRSLPGWSCPQCHRETLTADKANFKTIESTPSKAAHSHDDWEPEWIEASFCGLLKCSNSKCGEQVIVTGDLKVEEEYNIDDVPGRGYVDVLYPLFFIPTIPLFQISKDTPEQISKAVAEVFSTFWLDKSSCGNKIRKVVELIMNEKKVPKTCIDKKRKRREYSLHTRIELFEKRSKTIQDKKASELLMAIKWIGNSGSHVSNTLKQADIVDGLEILSHALDSLYDKEHLRVYKLSKEYNKSKGPLKRPLFSTKHIK